MSNLGTGLLVALQVQVYPFEHGTMCTVLFTQLLSVSFINSHYCGCRCRCTPLSTTQCVLFFSHNPSLYHLLRLQVHVYPFEHDTVLTVLSHNPCLSIIYCGCRCTCTPLSMRRLRQQSRRLTPQHQPTASPARTGGAHSTPPAHSSARRQQQQWQPSPSRPSHERSWPHTRV